MKMSEIKRVVEQADDFGGDAALKRLFILAPESRPSAREATELRKRIAAEYGRVDPKTTKPGYVMRAADLCHYSVWDADLVLVNMYRGKADSYYHSGDYYPIRKDTISLRGATFLDPVNLDAVTPQRALELALDDHQFGYRYNGRRKGKRRSRRSKR